MRLIETLSETIEQDESPFRAQLLREDIGRLQSLSDDARRAQSIEQLRESALRLNWTADPARTAELRNEITALSDAVYRLCARGDDAAQSDVEQTWLRLHQLRLERLVGCLSTPIPKPED